MRDEEYQRLDQVEESLWWFAGLRGMVLTLLDRHDPGPNCRLLDAGCGTGGMLKALAGRFPGATLHGLDFSDSACAFALRKTSATIQRGSVSAMPYADGAFDVVVSLDVLDSDDVDPGRAVAEFRRVLRPGGLLILNVAAYQWLLSYHDAAVGQSRRFTLGGINALLERAGFAGLQGTYWNTFLFPFMVLRRKLVPNRAGRSDVSGIAGPLDALCRGIVAVERQLIGNGIRLPFGGSVLAAARKVN